MLTDIFTPKECANCKLCCNFHRSSAWETPALEAEQIFLAHEHCIPLEKRPDGSTSFYLHFQTDSKEEIVNCPLLNPCDGCMLPREQRPFECRIWPVRIMKQHSKLVIGVYEKCPALKNEKFDELKSAVLINLLEPILAYAKRHPEAVRDFNTAYRIIWTS